MTRLQINSSPHGTLGEIVAVEEGKIIWAGPIETLDEAGTFDTLFCHDDDEERLQRIVDALPLRHAYP